jgi:molybdopterin converting factor small subunit
MIIEVVLYGPLAQFAGGKHVKKEELLMSPGATIKDLLEHFKIPTEEKGYLFINAVLSDAPGLNASLGEALHEGDHIGIFSIKHMWPYQYRDGVRMSESLRAEMQVKGAMKHTYRE